MGDAAARAGNGQPYARNSAVLGRQYRRFFGAAVAAALLLQFTIVTDTILVGQLLGPVPMSGVRVATPIVSLLNVVAVLVGVGGSTLVSISIGRRRQQDANQAFLATIALSVLLGLVFTVIVVPFAEPITRAISSQEATVEHTATFLRVVGLAAPLYVLAAVMAMLLRADSCIKLSSIVLIVSGVANVGFDVLFMGVLHFGVEGSGMASDAGMLVGVLASLAYIRAPQRTIRKGSLRGALSPTLAAKVMQAGAPGAVRMLFASVSLLAINYILGTVVGVEGIAFFTVCGNVQLLIVAFFSAGGQAAIPMEGVLYGERDFRGLRILLRSVFAVVLACVVVLVTVTCAFPSQIVRLFIPQGHEGADVLLRVYAIGFLPLAVNYVLTYYYNTVQRRGIAMTLTVCENLLFYVPLVWVCTHAWNLMGAMVAFVLTEVLALLAALLVANRVRRSQGLPDVLLVPNSSPEIVYEATSVATSADATALAHRVNDVLADNGVSRRAALQTSIAIEEMVVCLHLNNAHLRHDVNFDVIVRNLSDSVQVSLRDNGVPFDPAHTSEIAPKATPEEREIAMDGMAVLKSLATSVEYHYTLGLNHTVIQLGKEADATSKWDEHSEVDE